MSWKWTTWEKNTKLKCKDLKNTTKYCTCFAPRYWASIGSRLPSLIQRQTLSVFRTYRKQIVIVIPEGKVSIGLGLKEFAQKCTGCLYPTTNTMSNKRTELLQILCKSGFLPFKNLILKFSRQKYNFQLLMEETHFVSKVLCRGQIP